MMRAVAAAGRGWVDVSVCVCVCKSDWGPGREISKGCVRVYMCVHGATVYL